MVVVVVVVAVLQLLLKAVELLQPARRGLGSLEVKAARAEDLQQVEGRGRTCGQLHWGWQNIAYNTHWHAVVVMLAVQSQAVQV